MSGISPKTHDAITRTELRALIAACEECECDFNCYCASNIQWAERKLAELDRNNPVMEGDR